MATLNYLQTPFNAFSEDKSVEISSIGSQVTFNIEGDNIMADFDGSKPVKTVRDNEFKIVLVDGQSSETATKKLSIVNEGDAFSTGVNDAGIPLIGQDGSGNAIILPVPLPITDNSGSITVDASDLDIRNLAFATDTVDVSGSSVNISDNGGSITVDASDLDIRDLAYATDSVTAYQGTSPWVVSATDLDIRDLSSTTDSVSAVQSGTWSVNISDNGGSITVDASDLDIRDLSHTQDSIKIGDGTDFLAVNADGSINVVISGDTGGEVNNYNTSATVGVGSSVNHDYVITSGKTFKGETVVVGARGAVKVRVGFWNGTTFTPKMAYFQDPKDNKDHQIQKFSLLGDGTAAIRIEITNLDAASSDVYSNLQGNEI